MSNSNTRTIHALVCFDYEGPDPAISNVHAFGFMQTEDDGPQDCNTESDGSSQFGNFHAAQDLAHQHWQKHFTFRVVDKIPYEMQHTFAYEPEVLIRHLFTWGVDMAKFDPTLPRSTK